MPAAATETQGRCFDVLFIAGPPGRERNGQFRLDSDLCPYREPSARPAPSHHESRRLQAGEPFPSGPTFRTGQLAGRIDPAASRRMRPPSLPPYGTEGEMHRGP